MAETPSITMKVDCTSLANAYAVADALFQKVVQITDKVDTLDMMLGRLGEGSEIEEHLTRLEGIVGLQTIVPWANDPDRYTASKSTREVHTQMIEQLREELAKERQAHLSTQVGLDQTARILKSVQRSCDATQQERRALQRSYETVSNANLSLQEQILILQTELDELRGSRELADELGADLEKLHLTATNSTLQLDCPYCDGIGKWQHRPWKETTDAPTTP